MIRISSIAIILAFLAVPTASFAADTDLITRAGALALLIESDPESGKRAEWYRSHMPPVALFEDVRQDLWYAPYIETGFERKWIRGDHGRYRPGAVLTSADAAALVSPLWVEQSPIILLPWMQGIYYTPTLQDIASSYGMQTTVGPRPMPRSEFIAILQRIYGPSTVVQLPEYVMQWVGTSRSQTVAQQPASVPAENSLVPHAIAQMVPPVSTPEQVNVVPQQPSAPVVPAPVVPAPVVQRPVSAPSAITTTPVVAMAHTDAFSISLPTLGINDLSVGHPANPFTHQGLLEPLKTGVGHLFSYPGRGGKILIYGHSSSYAWDVSPFTKIFRRINELAVGDTVTVNYEGVARSYKVREKKTVPASDMTSYQNEGDGEELILYTCWPPDSITQRYLVIADPIGAVAAR